MVRSNSSASRFLAPAVVVLVTAVAPVAGIQSPGSLVAAHKAAAQAGSAAVNAHKAGKFDEFLSAMRVAYAQRPDHPRHIYNLAAALALNGKSVEAIQLVERLAHMGLSLPAETDDDFISLRTDARFVSACVEMERNAKPDGSSSVAFSIPGNGLILEGLAWDPGARAFFASSVHERKIIRIDKTGAASDFADRTSGLWSVFGMAVDPDRKLLWAATGAVAQSDGYTDKEAGMTALVAFSTASGKVVRRLEPSDGKKHTLGDVVCGPNGTVYATDSTGGAVFVARPGATSLEAIVEAGELLSPQGIAVTPDGGRLLVADYALGLCVVDLASRTVKRMPAPENTCLLGIDGLTRHGNDLLVVQNGIRPHRIARVRLNAGLTAVEGLDVLEVSNPRFDEPTLGVVADGWFHYIANSQWSKIGENGALAPLDQFRETVVLKLRP